MRSILIAGAAAFLLAGSAFAQPTTAPDTATTPDTKAPAAETTPIAPPPPSGAVQNPPPNNGPSNPAVKTTEGNNPGAPVAGANSFTEGQAKSRIESKGYSNVTSLVEDDQGVWRGKADKDGKAFDVSLDYQGNVVVR